MKKKIALGAIICLVAVVSAESGRMMGGKIGSLIGVIGAVIIGALGGYMSGEPEAKKKAEFGSEEAGLDTCLNQAESTNKKLVAEQKKINN